MTCDYVGCNNEANYKMTQTMGKKGSTHCCSGCAPSWVKSGEQSEAEKSTGSTFWKVDRIQ